MYGNASQSELEELLIELNEEIKSTSSWKVTQCIELELKKLSLTNHLKSLKS